MLPYYVTLTYVIKGLGVAGDSRLSLMWDWFDLNKSNLTPQDWDNLICSAYRRYDVYWETSADVEHRQNQRFIQQIFNYYNMIEENEENEVDVDVFWDHDRWVTVKSNFS